MEKEPAIYILASGYHGTTYTGVTNNLARRIWEHKEDITKGFTHKYQTKTLVYFECFTDMAEAITRKNS